VSTGRTIAERYEIREEDLLGQGGMGDVYRGTDIQTGRAVAVKVLNPVILASQPDMVHDLVARFVREGEALRQLNHPNIVEMVAAVEEQDSHYLIMAYVEGGSLRDLLETQGRLPIERVLDIALDLADALTRAHRLGVIHRDLKPGNVLLALDGTPRLTDFGHAHVAARPRLTQTGMVVGTIGYLSPEACNAETLDNRADIWSLGVMLYEMLTGELPFAGDTLVGTLTAILTQPVPDVAGLRRDVPEPLADLVYRMLEKDRQQRIPSVRLVGAELEAILAAVSRTTSDVGRQPSLLVSRFATPTPTAAAPRQPQVLHNLPVQPTPFVGREAELKELAGLLAEPDARLVTVLGAGGMGKTRLALEVAATQIDQFERGVCFVPLAPLGSGEAIAPTVAQALGFSFREEGEPRGQLIDYLRRKSLLLVMDGFEQLLPPPSIPPHGGDRGGGVDLASDILQTSPQVKILATSRVRLNVQGEQLFHLGAMDYPDRETAQDAADYGAVQLFVTSARRAQPGFELTAEAKPHVAQICRRVGGVPLGIVLAAGWVEMLTPAEIAAEIGRSLDFLETDLHDVPERQRSMRSVFDHSWHLLTGREREVMQVLSVFRGGCTREAAQQVSGATLRQLMGLVNKSLLRRTPTGRYEVDGLLQGYAAEKLARSPAASQAAHDGHSAYYAAALQGWAQELQGPRQGAALAEMDVESENARVAWDWAVEQGQVARIDQALDGLCRFYLRRVRYHEGETACRLASEKLEAAASVEGLRVWAKALAWQGCFCRLLGRIEVAGQLLQQSLAVMERPELSGQEPRRERAFALHYMGHVLEVTDIKEARRLIEESLTLYQALGDRRGEAVMSACLGEKAMLSGDFDDAQRLFKTSLAIRQALGDQRAPGPGSYTVRKGRVRQGPLGVGGKRRRVSGHWGPVSTGLCSYVLGIRDPGTGPTWRGVAKSNRSIAHRH
jgi:predicted ATPase/predicted Ser/Thr protein kinase